MYTIARVPIQAGMLEAVHYAHEKDCDIYIVSDANTVFIQCMLELHGLGDIIKKVFTNPAEFHGDTLSLRPYHSKDIQPHSCSNCPANMCKGKECPIQVISFVSMITFKC